MLLGCHSFLFLAAQSVHRFTVDKRSCEINGISKRICLISSLHQRLNDGEIVGRASWQRARSKVDYLSSLIFVKSVDVVRYFNTHRDTHRHTHGAWYDVNRDREFGSQQRRSSWDYFSAAVLNTHVQREKHRNTTDTVSVSTEQTHSQHSR